MRIWLSAAWSRRSRLMVCVILVGLAGCLPDRSRQDSDFSWAIVRVDGQEHVVQTEASSVRGLLAELDITLGELDLIEPDIWSDLQPGTIVTITRVEEERERVVIPYPQQLLRDESRSPGETLVLSEGSPGEEELVYHLIKEAGKEISRELVETRLISEAQPEVVLVGIKGMVPPTKLPGLLAYISGGNAWLIDGRDGEKRPLTFDGDLDGRCLAFAADGTRLLFSRVISASVDSPLNTLWMVDTRLRNESPMSLGVEGVLYASWLSEGQKFAYSTAVTTQGSPGWRANNDLWVSSADGITVTQVLAADSTGLYSWWGTNFVEAHNRRFVAYSRASELGVIDTSTGVQRALLWFAPYHTYAEWVWLPALSWSPDDKWLAAVVHVPSAEAETLEDSPAFDLWIVNPVTDEQRSVIQEVGLWASPAWSPRPFALEDGRMVELAYLQARRPLTSDESPYDLCVTDREGSYVEVVYPAEAEAEVSVPDYVWSPRGNQIVVAMDGNLYLVDVDGGTPRALTADGLSGRPRWVLPPSNPMGE